MNRRLPRLLIYSSHVMVLVDLQDMLASQCQVEVVTCISAAQALLALEGEQFAAAIIDDTGEGVAVAGLQRLCGILEDREIPFVCLITSEDRRNQLCPATQHRAVAMRKPVQESALRAAVAKMLTAAIPVLS